MDTLCSVCNEALDDETNVFECDGCCDSFHLHCGGATRTEVKTRKNSRCMRIFCKVCVASPETCAAENMKTILKLSLKLDTFNAKQIETNIRVNDILSNLAEKINDMYEKFESFNMNEATSNTKPSYAKAVKTKVNPVVVVKPKEKQASKKTVDDIRAKVNSASIKVCNARNIKDGGIVLSCENSNDTMKVKKIVEESYGKNYDVRLPEAKKPRVRITNVSDQIAEDQLIIEIKKMNAELKDVDMKIITVIKRQKQSYTFRDIIVEVNGCAYKKMLKMGAIFLDWRTCQITEHIHIQRCFKCCGFSHISSECKVEHQRCSKCAGTHRYENCRKKIVKCINCMQIIDKYGAEIDANHHAWSKNCKVLQRKIEALRMKIEYNSNM